MVEPALAGFLMVPGVGAAGALVLVAWGVVLFGVLLTVAEEHPASNVISVKEAANVIIVLVKFFIFGSF